MNKYLASRNLAVTPDLRQIQIESFCHFLMELLPFELQKLSEVVHETIQFHFHMLGQEYRLQVPQHNPQQATYQLTTYGTRIHVPVCLYNQIEKTYEVQTVCLGKLPLMTLNGSFVINGISRCVVSQLIRSPGLYYTLNTENNYIATIISNSGKRLKLKLNMGDGIWVIFHNNATVHLNILLVALGFEFDRIPNSLKSFTVFPALREHPPFPRSVDEAMALLMPIIKPNTSKIKTDPSLNEYLLQDYPLGVIGRFNFNRRLGLNELTRDTELGLEDLVFAALHLLKFRDGQASLDDIDDLKHKRVKRVAEIVHEHLQNVLILLNKKVQNTLIKRTLTKRSISAGYFFYMPILNLERLFTSYELSQFLDQTNPLADIVHKRKLSALGPGGLTPRTARFRVRDIHPSQYGRICPIETAEGEKAGIVTALTTASSISHEGHITNIMYAISSPSMKGQLISSIAHNDEYRRIATGRVLNLILTPVQHRREFASMSWDEVSHRSVVPLHFFAIGVGLIPFLEHDDSTRALMGSNMQRQAVSLSTPVKPVVGTGIEGQVGIDSGTTLISPETGYVEYVDRQTIILRNLITGKAHEIKLTTFARLNNNIPLNQRPLVKPHQYLQKGEIIADSNATAGGELALGQNVLVAYMPWEGYNFEDAILISERLVNDQVYTSVSIERYETEIRITNDLTQYLTKDVPQLSKYVLRHLDNQGLVKLGQWVEPGDVLVGKLTVHQTDDSFYGPEIRLLQAIFGTEAINTQETCLKVPLRGRGRVIDVRSLHSDNTTFGQTNIIHVYVLHNRTIQVGDKLAGRHGNKGVVSKILPRSAMPYLSDGTSVDMVLSPLGVPSRMNVGQIFECLLGLSGVFLNKNYRVLPFDERYESQASRKLVLSELYYASQLSQSPWLFQVNTPGKMSVFDGRTGEAFDQSVTIGRAYMFKLIHQVEDKIHARSTGPYAIVTQQPLRGKSRQGGQRVGEMEVWAFQGFGAAYTLQELLTLKSDHIKGRATAIKAIIKGKSVPFFTTSPDCLRAFIRELWSLGLCVHQSTVSEKSGLNYEKEL